MFNYYCLEKMSKEKESKDKHKNDTKYIQKRNILVERYSYNDIYSKRNLIKINHRERVVKFIERMAMNPLKANDEVYESVLNQTLYKSKMLGDFTILINKHNDKERLKETLANAKFITEPSKELRKCFNLRARDKSKEIVPSFGLRMKPSVMFNNNQDSINNETSKSNSKNLLPNLSTKTHFKGATTLMSDLREIGGVYNDAKLRSRFKVLERNLDKNLTQFSHSVDPRDTFENSRANFADHDKSIQKCSKNELIIKDFTYRSRAHEELESNNKPKYKSHAKRMQSLKRHINITSNPPEQNKLQEVSDYGGKKLLSST